MRAYQLRNIMSHHKKHSVVFPPKDLKGLVTSLVVLVVLGSLGYWWYTSELPLAKWMGGLGERSEQVSTGTNNDTQAQPSGQASPRPSAIQGERDVVSIIASLPSVSSFRSYFTATGVAAAMSRESVGPYTVFVPTNAAIARLTKGTISGRSAAEQSRLVKYHVVVGREVNADALRAGTLAAFSGDMLNFTSADGVSRVNSAAIIGTYRATNGTVYVIDDVLLPPTRPF
jgi:uncharacterized surface protein with fasciclin (FAS1) repeats